VWFGTKVARKRLVSAVASSTCRSPQVRTRAPPSLHYERRRPDEGVLYKTIQAHLETFLSHAAEVHDGIGVPRFVEKELRAFLKCGVLAHGFCRFKCADCSHERLIALSCKGRGFCASCGGKRMTDIAAHLVDHIIPAVPVRQFVLSLPHWLRYRLAYDHDRYSGARDLHSRAARLLSQARQDPRR
jgi:Transposase zinc-binding domain